LPITYNYRNRITKHGTSVTRFLKDGDGDESTPQQLERPRLQQHEPLNTAGSLGQLEATLSNKTRLMLELKKLQIRMNTIVQELEIEIK
jgi:hypothetical protein